LINSPSIIAPTGAFTGQNTESQDSLWHRHAEASTSEAFFQTWLALQCLMIEGTVQGVLILGPPESGPFVPAAFWPAGMPPGQLLADAAGRTLEARQAQIVRAASSALVSCPLVLDGQLHGLVAIETALRDESRLREMVRHLRWGLYAIESSLRDQQSHLEQSTRERLIATLDLVASVLAEEGFQASAQALATDLATRLDCDRVSIGLVRDKHARVIAVSHSAEFGERMNLIRAVGTAMDESLDQKSIIVLPLDEGEVMVTRDHAVLSRQFGSDNILTVPFSVGKDTTGAFTFERPAGRPFDANAVELCQAVVALCARILEEKRLNDRHLPGRVMDSVRGEVSKLTGPRHFGRKIGAIALMAAAVFFTFATAEFKVGANSSLEGTVRRVLVAPLDGYVASASHRAGDVVKKDAVLAALDDRDLKLEYFKAAGQRDQYAKQYQEANAQHDRAQSNIVLAQVQQAEAQMNLLAEQLNRLSIAAPFEGLVVSGDLSQSLGTAVKRGQVLFEVAPLNAYRVVLEVDEGDISYIKAGQKGSLMLASLPGEVFPLAITHVTPIAVAKEGRSFFRVEALLGRMSDRLRPGMEGVARVEAGERKLFWIGTRKLADWVRLTLWSWI
jgi:multidrug resistance efflux pump